MKTNHPSEPHVSAGRDTRASHTATTRSGPSASPTLTTNSDRQVHFTPPFAFEVEEFHSQIPEENGRHQQGVPQTLEFPSTRN